MKEVATGTLPVVGLSDAGAAATESIPRLVLTNRAADPKIASDLRKLDLKSLLLAPTTWSAVENYAWSH